MDLNAMIKTVCIDAIPLVLALVLHEIMHGYMALKNGDPTAKLAGRLTLNPLDHISLLGTVIFPLVLLILHFPFLIGWAKPVPVNPARFHNYREGMREVAASGPIVNLVMLFIWAFLLVLMELMSEKGWSNTLVSFITDMSYFGIMINGVLGIFNLIPIPPLDGSRIVDSFLPPAASRRYNALAPYGILIVLCLMYAGFFTLITPIIRWISNLALGLWGSLLGLLF